MRVLQKEFKVSDKDVTASQPEAPEIIGEITLDPQTYLNIELAQMDNEKADLEIKEALVKLELAKLQKRRTQTINDYNTDQLKQRLQSEQSTAPAVDSLTSDAPESSETRRKERKRRRG
jgi:hypothetical protein